MRRQSISVLAMAVLFAVGVCAWEPAFAGFTVGRRVSDYCQMGAPTRNDFVPITTTYWDHVLAHTFHGSIIACARNEYGQHDVPSGNDLGDIASAGYFSINLTSDGRLIGLADNWAGQADVPRRNDSATIAAADWHSLTLNSGGSLEAWRWNPYGGYDVPIGYDDVAIADSSDYGPVLIIPTTGLIVLSSLGVGFAGYFRARTTLR